MLVQRSVRHSNSNTKLKIGARRSLCAWFSVSVPHPTPPCEHVIPEYVRAVHIWPMGDTVNIDACSWIAAHRVDRAPAHAPYI